MLNQLYRYSPLQTSFGVNTLALNGNKPQLLNLKQILEALKDLVLDAVLIALGDEAAEGARSEQHAQWAGGVVRVEGGAAKEEEARTMGDAAYSARLARARKDAQGGNQPPTVTQNTPSGSPL